MVSTCDEPLDAKEFRELVLRDEADEARRKDVRRPEGEKRERMALNREVCILADFVVCNGWTKRLKFSDELCRNLSRRGDMIQESIADFSSRRLSEDKKRCETTKLSRHRRY